MTEIGARAIGAQWEALLLERILTPMASGFGEFGGLAVRTLADSVARRDPGGFGAIIAGFLEQRHD